jgi:N-acetylmuramoyl-L-alanine amidase
VADKLKSKGIDVKMSRNTIASNVGTKLNESLNGRCNMANSWGADYFISIHCNASSPSANGTETLICGDKAKILAQLVNSNLVGLGLTDRGVKQRPELAVLKHTNMPAILVETAFITNPSDAKFLTDKQDDIAQAICNAVFEFLGIEVNTMIETAEQAIQKLVEKGIINSPEYWTSAYQVVNNLDKLLINMANAI